MSRHPLYGVLPAKNEAGDMGVPPMPTHPEATSQPTPATARRIFFAQAIAGLLGAGSLLALGRRAQAQGAGEAGRSFDRGYSGTSSDSAFGYRNSGGNSGGGRVTTYALGEEGSRPPGGGGGRVTTYALGEEGSRPPGRGRVTTYALGEEGNYYRSPNYRSYRPYYPRPRYTTYALGEEGGYRY